MQRGFLKKFLHPNLTLNSHYYKIWILKRIMIDLEFKPKIIELATGVYATPLNGSWRTIKRKKKERNFNRLLSYWKLLIKRDETTQFIWIALKNTLESKANHWNSFEFTGVHDIQLIIWWIHDKKIFGFLKVQLNLLLYKKCS
jgi:hypothetical protein